MLYRIKTEEELNKLGPNWSMEPPVFTTPMKAFFGKFFMSDENGHYSGKIIVAKHCEKYYAYLTKWVTYIDYKKYFNEIEL